MVRVLWISGIYCFNCDGGDGKQRTVVVISPEGIEGDVKSKVVVDK